MNKARPGKTPVTIINVISVKETDQERIRNALVTVCQRVVKKQPGFISAQVYASLNGRRVAIHGEWESRDAFDAAFRNPELLNTFRQFLDVAQPEWHLYERVYET